jgi:ATP phosphoribosyltransferase regulatory subunit
MVFRGLKTWLPSDVRKQLAIKNKLVALYEKWSYEPIVVQSLVDLDVINRANKKFTDKTFTFLDKDGETLALRTEMTQPIAKAIAGRAQELQFPVKLYYNASVYRYKGTPTDESREIQQVGIEYVGAKAEENFSDYEVLQLMIDSIEELGVSDYQICITDAKIWHSLFTKFNKPVPVISSEASSNHDLITKAYNLLLKGEFVAFEKLATEESFLKCLYSREQISLSIPNEEKLKRVEKDLGLDLSHLKSLAQLSSKIVFAPYQCPDLKLYTGLHFKLLIKGQGNDIAMGGRYDNLYSSFGIDLTAIGFAFYVQRLISALSNLDLLDNFSTDKLPKKLSPTAKEWGDVYKAAQLEFEKGANVLICNK